MDSGIEIITKTLQDAQQGRELMEKLLRVASPEGVYGQPIVAGEYTVITASEVRTSLGYGVGGGVGTNPAEKQEQGQADTSFGSGGGGGGFAAGRPVAVITVSPQGVKMGPVVDATKVALAFFTALGAMFMMFAQMNKAARRQR